MTVSISINGGKKLEFEFDVTEEPLSMIFADRYKIKDSIHFAVRDVNESVPRNVYHTSRKELCRAFFAMAWALND